MEAGCRYERCLWNMGSPQTFEQRGLERSVGGKEGERDRGAKSRRSNQSSLNEEK